MEFLTRMQKAEEIMVDTDAPKNVAPTVSVIVPAKNEALNLEHVLPMIPSWVHEVILVDGHSTDKTIAVARYLLPSIRVIEQEGRGKGDALRAGFAAATGDIIVMIDADGSTDPREIPAFVDALVAGADFVKGSRFKAGGGTADMSHLRRLGNWGLTTLVKTLFGGDYTDLCYGYNAFWRRVVPALNLPDPATPGPADGGKLWGDGFEIETLINVRVAAHGLRITEVPSIEHLRIHGESNLDTVRDGTRVLRTILSEFGRERRLRRTRRRQRTAAVPVTAEEG